MLDGTYLSRNFATLGPFLTLQPPCHSRLTSLHVWEASLASDPQEQRKDVVGRLFPHEPRYEMREGTKRPIDQSEWVSFPLSSPPVRSPLRPFAATSGNLGSRLASSSNPLIIGNGRSWKEMEAETGGQWLEEPYGLTVLISCNPWANCGVSFGSSFQDVIALDPHEKRLAQGRP